MKEQRVVSKKGNKVDFDQHHRLFCEILLGKIINYFYINTKIDITADTIEDKQVRCTN